MPLFNVRFVKLLIIDASEIIPEFQEYTIWLPINIMGEELRPQSVDFWHVYPSFNSSIENSTLSNV